MSAVRHDWRELGPIPVDERPEVPDRVSQTLLSREAVCPRSALLYHLHRGGTSSHELQRGSAFHDFARQAVELMVAQNEPSIPPDVAKDLMQTVIDSPEWTIPPAEADRLRLMSHHFAEGFTVDPQSVAGVELMLECELGGVLVRGKLDLVLSTPDGLAVRDYKSSFNLPAQDEFEAGLQLPIYAVLLAYGTPEGQPFPLGRGAEMFDIGELYPMYLWEDPVTLGIRQAFLSAAEVADHRAYVEGLAAKVVSRFRSGDFPAIPGSHCSTCAAPSDCPLPARLRGYRGGADTLSDASHLANSIVFDERDLKARKKELRRLASALGPVPAGSDVVFDFQEQESRETDWDGLEAGIERAVQFGEEFDLDVYRKVRRSTRFGARKLKPDEKGEAA